MAAALLVLLMSTGAVAASEISRTQTFRYTYGCYDAEEVRVDMLMGHDVVAYVDFSRKELVWMIPHIPESVKREAKDRVYTIAKAAMMHCQSVLDKAKRADPGVPMRQEAPVVFIYSRYEGEDGVMNTLFCFSKRFYPPTINVTWTKNQVEVQEGVRHLRYHHDDDGTFHRMSTLSITPQLGDVYSCRVEHQSLEAPFTRSWELRTSPVNAAAVFLGVSLMLCLMGIGCHAFFLSKQPS